MNQMIEELVSKVEKLEYIVKKLILRIAILEDELASTFDDYDEFYIEPETEYITISLDIIEGKEQILISYPKTIN